MGCHLWDCHSGDRVGENMEELLVSTSIRAPINQGSMLYFYECLLTTDQLRTVCRPLVAYGQPRLRQRNQYIRYCSVQRLPLQAPQQALEVHIGHLALSSLDSLSIYSIASNTSLAKVLWSTSSTSSLVVVVQERQTELTFFLVDSYYDSVAMDMGSQLTIGWSMYCGLGKCAKMVVAPNSC